MRRLRALTETECYLRCYGGGDDSVRIVRAVRRRPRPVARLTGEELRRLFEVRLDARERAAA